MKMTTRNGKSNQVVSAAGVHVTLHKSVRNNWTTIEHREGGDIRTRHESRQAALRHAEACQ